MTPKVPTSAQLAQLRAAFATRRRPTRDDFFVVAALAGMSEPAVRRAWSTGWPSAGVAPLEPEFREPGESARAHVVAPLVEGVRAELVARALVEQAHMLGAQFAKLTPTIERLVARLDGANLDDVAPGAALGALRTLASTFRDVVGAATAAVQLERVVGGGKPDAQQEPATVSLDEATRELNALFRAVERAAQRKVNADGGDGVH